MQETSVILLSKLLRLSQGSVLRADKDILTLLNEVRPICLDGRRALIIDEKYLGCDKKFVTCVIDGNTGEILWLKVGNWLMNSVGRRVNSKAIQSLSENTFEAGTASA